MTDDDRDVDYRREYYKLFRSYSEIKDELYEICRSLNRISEREDVFIFNGFDREALAPRGNGDDREK